MVSGSLPASRVKRMSIHGFSRGATPINVSRSGMIWVASPPNSIELAKEKRLGNGKEQQQRLLQA